MWRKLSEAVGSAPADPTAEDAARQPVPPVVIPNKPAPGLTGPRGLSPRTTYTRSHSMAPPVPDVGSSGQKSQEPRGLEFLPTKVAHQEMNMPTTAMKRPQLHELIKEAVAGTVSKVDIDAEAARQLANMGGAPSSRIKTAAARPPAEELTPTEYIDKLAGALDYAASVLAKQADIGTTSISPGEGPNTLEVTEAPSGENPVQPGNQGEATEKNRPPMNPPVQSSGVAKDPSNAMATNDDMMHGEQPVEPISNEKTSAALYARNLGRFGLRKVAAGEAGFYTGDALANIEALQAKHGIEPGEAADLYADKQRRLGGLLLGTTGGISGLAMGGAAGEALGGSKGALIGGGLGALGGALGGYAGGRAMAGHEADLMSALYKKRAAEASAPKTASSNLYAKNLAVFGLQKVAEDAINPAQISAGPADAQGAEAPPGASPAEEQVPSEPSDVNKQKSLISSNQAAIDYTKAQAKADPKSDMGDVVDEPALSASTDKTLDMLFARTQEAGAKISADLTRTAAAQALLAKHAAEAMAAKAGKKEKQSQMNPNPQLSTPAGQSGFRSDSQGM